MFKEDETQYCKNCYELREQLDQLKAKNKELIRKNAKKRTSLKKKQLHITQLKAENKNYKKMLEDEEVQLALIDIRTGERHLWFNKAEKLKQTLTEIKEIIEQGVKIHDDIIVSKQILQKISEVEDD